MMKARMMMLAFALMLSPAALQAQAVTSEPQAPVANASTLRDQLMPAPASALLIAPAAEEKAADTLEPAMQRGGSGVGYMIAGAALFVAGLLVEGDAGTVLVLAGAGIGAYGLYVHFR
jgi:hypothetical protein